MSWDLIADIGGTNMRLAASHAGEIIERKKYPTVGEKSLADAINEFCGIQGSTPRRAAMAAAGIVENGSVTLTNTGTIVSEAIINEAAGIGNAKVLNDFEAAAWSLADIRREEVEAIQGDGDLQKAARVIIGPGTGLGVGALVWSEGRPAVVQGEGGHVRLSPDTSEELEIFERLGELWPETRMGDGKAVEAEAILSGTGLPFFHRAIAELAGAKPAKLTASGIFEASRSGDPIAEKTIRLFAKYLGEFAGDMAVTFAARGGVFLAGGVIAANPWMFDDNIFLDAFNSGGRHSGFRRSLPVYFYTNDDFGLQGAMNYLGATD